MVSLEHLAPSPAGNENGEPDFQEFRGSDSGHGDGLRDRETTTGCNYRWWGEIVILCIVFQDSQDKRVGLILLFAF